MTRKTILSSSIDADLLEEFDQLIPSGRRSEAIEGAVRKLVGEAKNVKAQLSKAVEVVKELRSQAPKLLDDIQGEITKEPINSSKIEQLIQNLKSIYEQIEVILKNYQGMLEDEPDRINERLRRLVLS